MALPNSRETSFTAEATPCLAGGSEETIAVVAGVPASAIPAAKRTRPISEVPVAEVHPDERENDQPGRDQRQPDARRCG